MSGDVPVKAGLAGYAVALETIIRSLPGQVLVNGQAMSNEAGLLDLRGRFEVADLLPALEHGGYRLVERLGREAQKEPG